MVTNGGTSAHLVYSPRTKQNQQCTLLPAFWDIYHAAVGFRCLLLVTKTSQRVEKVASVLPDAGVTPGVSVISPPLDLLPTGGSTIMMAIKERHFSPLEDVSLEELVPKD